METKPQADFHKIKLARDALVRKNMDLTKGNARLSAFVRKLEQENLELKKTAFEASRKVVSLQSQIQELQHSHHTEQNVCKMAILAYQEVVTAVNESLDIFKTVALPGLTLVMDRAESFDEKIIDELKNRVAKLNRPASKSKKKIAAPKVEHPKSLKFLDPKFVSANRLISKKDSLNLIEEEQSFEIANSGSSTKQRRAPVFSSSSDANSSPSCSSSATETSPTSSPPCYTSYNNHQVGLDFKNIPESSFVRRSNRKSTRKT